MKKIGILICFAIWGVVSILWIESTVSSLNTDNSRSSSPTITSDEYRGVKIAQEAQGKVTEAEVDDIIEEHGAEGVIVWGSDEGEEINYRNYVYGVIWCVSLCGLVLCCRRNRRFSMGNRSMADVCKFGKRWGYSRSVMEREYGVRAWLQLKNISKLLFRKTR